MYLVPLWGTAGVGRSAWPLAWQRGHSPEPGLPPGSTSPPAVAHQHHTSCCTVRVKKQEGEHERHFLVFYSSQVLCSAEVSQSLLWIPVLEEVWVKCHTDLKLTLPFFCWRGWGWGRARESLLFISLLQLRTIFVWSVDAGTENGESGCCKPDTAPQTSHTLNVHQLLLREKEKVKTWTPGSRGDTAASCMPGVWCMLFLRQ